MKKLFPFLQSIKDHKNSLLKPLATLLSKQVSSNFLTLLSFTAGVLAATFLFQSHTLFITFIIISVLLDILDGAVAKVEKKTGPTLKKGILLDDLSDRTVLVLLLLKIAAIKSYPFLPIIIIGYIIIKGLHIYLKQTLETPPTIVYIDRLPFIFFIFQEYLFGIYILAVSLLINIFEFLFLSRKHN